MCGPVLSLWLDPSLFDVALLSAQKSTELCVIAEATGLERSSAKMRGRIRYTSTDAGQQTTAGRAEWHGENRQLAPASSLQTSSVV